LILCGHDHQDAIHTIERGAHGLIISSAGTISNRLRSGRASSFNIVEIEDHEIHITAHAWRQGKGFIPSEDLSPSLEVPGLVIAGVNTAHGITRGSITRRLRDLGVIGQVRHADVMRVREIFEHAAPDSARIVMMHHNPIRGELSGRHGLANTEQALHAFADLGTELILCGHDHQDAIHTIERGAHGLIISTAGTISNRIRPGRASSFNVVEIEDHEIHITAHAWRQGKGFIPSEDRTFPRRTASRQA
ncbi:MAG: metallophosphoesterase family protein, partial [Rubrobacter sp.]